MMGRKVDLLSAENDDEISGGEAYNTKKLFVMSVSCFIGYLIIYFSRNVLSVTTPQLISDGIYTTEYIGLLSTLFMITYAAGQLINGYIGDIVKVKYMIAIGMITSGICYGAFAFIPSYAVGAVTYALSGFFMSMIYSPMTKVIAENSPDNIATRALLGLALASLVASPLSGIVSMLFMWRTVFVISIILMMVSGVAIYAVFCRLEREGVITYRNEKSTKKEGTDALKTKQNIKDKSSLGTIKTLIDNGIIRYTFIAILTGIIRTSVIFWIPTLLSMHLGYSTSASSGLYSAVTLIVSFAPYIGVFIYKYPLRRNINITMSLSFALGAVAFFAMCAVTMPVIGVVLLVIALLCGNMASAMLWNVYCPGLKDTGKVSTATGYLDCISYVGGALANIIFANAVEAIGWTRLLIVWGGMMLVGILPSLIHKTAGNNKSKSVNS